MKKATYRITVYIEDLDEATKLYQQLKQMLEQQGLEYSITTKIHLREGVTPKETEEELEL